LLNDFGVDYALLVNDLFEKVEVRNEAAQLLEGHCTHILSFTLDMFTPFEERTLLAQGELISSALFNMYLNEIGLQSKRIDALDFMRIDQMNEPDLWYMKSNLNRLLKEYSSKVYVTQGYICRNHFGEIDNLKRGGSDYSASIIGAKEVQIWTDIGGMHNNDHRILLRQDQ
tara:strand:+ start:35 stop:547 length:513 start_codon:yes stop_codon:yes gene_type:complete